MKLLRCYVENFGKISKQEFQFKDNLTIFKEENGWGKTTLSVFIKAMLYGFERNTKEKAERQKYMPWNKGKYGGNLDLEINRVTYRIERFFGDTPKGDKFTLINLETNKEVKTYTEKIGEEIFKLDKESFEKSIYIPQQEIEVQISNDLTTKLTNLDTIQDDMDKYDEAQKNLNKKSDQLKKKIKNIDIEIKETEIKLKRCEQTEVNLEKHEQEYKAIKEEQENEKRLIEQLEEKIKTANEQQLKEQIKKQYEKIKEEEKNLLTKNEEMKSFFQKGIPSKEEILNIEEEIIRLKKSEEEIEEVNVYTELTNQEIEEKQELFNQYKQLERILQVENNENKTEHIKRSRKFDILALIIIALAVVLIVFIETRLIGALLLGFGVGVWSIYIWSCEKKKAKQIKKGQEQVIKNKEERDNKRNELFKYIYKYEGKYNEEEIYESLLKIKLKYEKYIKAQITLNEAKPKIEEFLHKYFDTVTNEYSNYLDNIKIKIVSNQEIQKRHNEVLYSIQEFLKEHNIEEIENFEKIEEPIENMREELYRIKRKTDITVQNLAFLDKKINEFYSIVDEKTEFEADLENYKEERNQLEKQKVIIDKTIEILEKAKEKLSGKYLKGMNLNLNKYIKLITENVNIVDKVSIDIDLNTNIEIDGEKKSLQLFSSGYKDLVGICIRLALIDSIFEEEKPFLILDDPFVNLDEEKINNAIKLIKDISREYQIIYFSCHESRT